MCEEKPPILCGISCEECYVNSHYAGTLILFTADILLILWQLHLIPYKAVPYSEHANTAQIEVI